MKHESINLSKTQKFHRSVVPPAHLKKVLKSFSPFALILNGTSSSGKSCISSILQKRINTPNIFFLSIDTFINMLPKCLIGETEETSIGFQFYTEGKGILNIKAGEQGNQIVRQMHSVTEDLLQSGSSVIIDHVVLTKTWADELENLRKTGAKIIYVLITCDVEELKKREISRGDRRIGLACGLKHVEDKIQRYDLIVDTTSCLPSEASEIILRYLGSENLNQPNTKS